MVLRSTGMEAIVGEEGKNCWLKIAPSLWHFEKLNPNIAGVADEHADSDIF